MIQLEISNFDSNTELIQKLKELFSFFSMINSETWVIGNHLNLHEFNKTKQIVELIPEKETYNSIKFFMLENMVCFHEF